MKALIFKSALDSIEYQNVPDPIPTKNKIVVEVLAAGLNRRDFWIIKGMYPNIPKTPLILGSDGCVSFLGKTYVVNPNINWGHENLPSPNYEILGLETPGTFAEKLLISKENLWPKPNHLTDLEAASIPLAGLTAFRALFNKAKINSKDKILISGIGGGVALLSFQMAEAIGAKVWVTSGSQVKIDRAIALGAQGGANYNNPDEMLSMAKQAGKFDVVIDGAGGAGFSTLLKMCGMGARVVSYGATRGAWQDISVPNIFFKQISVFGSTMGSDAEFGEMIKLVERYKIVPIIDSIYQLSEGAEALGKMALNNSFGKKILAIKGSD